MRGILLAGILGIATAEANEPAPFFVVSSVDGKELTSSPSQEFVERGGYLKKNEVFKADTHQFAKAALELIRKTQSKPSQVTVSRVEMVSFGEPNSDLWVFVVRCFDSEGNHYSVVFNGDGEAWPLGKVHDSFNDPEHPSPEAASPGDASHAPPYTPPRTTK